MNNKLNKNYFITALVMHLIFFAILFLFNSNNNNIAKRFLVLGAHSQIPSYAMFKSNTNAMKTNWLEQRKNAEKAILQKKAALQQAKKISTPKSTPKSIIKKAIAPTPKAKQTTIAQKTNTMTQDKKQFAAKKITTNKQIIPEKIEKENIKVAESKKEETINDLETDVLIDMNFNLLGETDPQIIMFQESIQKEVARLWKPPIGVPKGTQCSAAFSIDNKGSVKKFKFIKKSDVLIYDLSVLRVAKQFKFAKFLWGRKFSLDFRQ